MQKTLIDDRKLLELIHKDPDKGMNRLMDTYAGLVYYIVSRKIPGKEQDIEECMSDIFLEVYNKIDDFDSEKGNLKVFITTIADRRAIDRFRKIISVKEDDVEDETLFELPSDETPESKYIEKEKNSRLLAEIQKLGEPDSEILYRRYYLSQPVKSIAENLGMKSNTVTKRITRALSILKTRLEEYYYG